KNTDISFELTPKNGHCKNTPPIVELKNTIGGIFMGKQFGHIIAEEVFEMKRSSGQTHREMLRNSGIHTSKSGN
ncbi:MAG TPA: hypothetical protein PKN28_06230, partial [Clostridiales bacterium]|nr:hypothetical protein [Clostridiales bacterium]